MHFFSMSLQSTVYSLAMMLIRYVIIQRAFKICIFLDDQSNNVKDKFVFCKKAL